uniref:Uncharacterized protein n=1 Tax=Tetradesmus obliquus TaxID=3088 RepID=A0A383VNR6_TETOB|eukprot:jgi/Sobl393_1/16070/SZX67165.1
MAWRLFLVALLACASLASAHHGAESEHNELDSELAKQQQLAAVGVLDSAKAMRKSAINPSDDKVALLAANMASNPAASLKALSASHAGKGAAAAAAAAAGNDQDDQDDMKREDPEDVRGRRLRYNSVRLRYNSRRMLVSQP